MAAEKGNKYWELANWGKPKKYQPEELKVKAIEYFTWINANPLLEQKMSATGKVKEIKKMRAMTKTGFCLFAGITLKTFQNYAADEAYLHITEGIEGVIKTQKFEGAAAGLLNSNIIARELGLIDKQSIDNNVNLSRMANITFDLHEEPLEKPEKGDK